MKKILTCIAFLAIHCVGRTMIFSLDTTRLPIPDTICMPFFDAQKIYKAAIDGKSYKTQFDTASALISVMQKRLDSKDIIIYHLSLSVMQSARLSENHQKEVDNLITQRDKEKLDMQFYKNLFKRQKFRTVLTGIAGIVLTTGILLLKK